MVTLNRLFGKRKMSEEKKDGKATSTGRRRALAKLGVLRCFLVAFILLLFLAQGQVAYAATITVNTTDDELNSDGDCSLREAIQAANTDAVVDACPAGSGADTIVVPAGTYTLSIAGAGEDANASGDLDITDSLSITGAGADSTIINGNGIDRVFEVFIGTTVTISDITITGGYVGVDEAGGGIVNWYGNLTLNNSTVSGNSAGEDGGGIYNQEGMVTLNDSTVSGNSANAGGGIFNNGGEVVLTNSTVSGNSALRFVSSGSGGGILVDGPTTLTNSTVSGNSASDVGGGIFADGGPLTLTNSTVSGNSANAGGGILISDEVLVFNTIVANNPSGGDCYWQPVISLGHNLDSDGSCGLGAPGDIANTDPLLGPLADNGGPTQTHALLAGSPAIDAGSSDCPPPATDQRGVARPQGTACDIGAFEFEPPVITVAIDIKPGSDPNSINCTNEKEVISVAALTTDDFDAITVDHRTVTFEGASETHVDKKSGEPRRHEEDVDYDGDTDLVFHFRLGDTDLTCESTEGTLTGEIFDGFAIEGTDAVRMIDKGGGEQ